MSITYKIGQNDFDIIFLPESPEKLSCFGWKLFFNKVIFRIICLNYEIRTCFSVGVSSPKRKDFQYSFTH